ncbi:MAG: hypothetical protein J0L72_06890 [Armatimonadetes bacterium]|nr:hypothetical protein [Armatimonadota bacterium]
MTRQFGQESALWAVQQSELRKKAGAKFVHPERLLFTKEALEQATHHRVSDYHADRFPPGVRVLDMTCGIGADSMALAKHCDLVGAELDPERAFYAEFNLEAMSLNGEIRCIDSYELHPNFEFAFADPGRRQGGKRIVDPDEYLPNPSEIASRGSHLSLLGIKLSPVVPDSYLESLGGRTEFVSFGRECREACVWKSPDRDYSVSCVHIESGESLASRPITAVIDEPGEFLYDADPAAVRAHALGNFNAAALGDSPGYLTADHSIESPWLRRYRVLWYGRFDVSDIKSTLKKLDSKTPEIKQRGTEQDLIALRKKWILKGDQECIVVLFRVQKSIRAIICREI